MGILTGVFINNPLLEEGGLYSNRNILSFRLEGALPTLYPATSPEIQGGEFIGLDGFLAQRGYPHKARSSGRPYDLAAAKRLWEVSEEITGVRFGV